MYRSCICGQGAGLRRRYRSLVLKRRRRNRRGGQASDQIGSKSGERRAPGVAAISASRADASEIPSTQAELFWPKVSR
jgi:hypothetical protein